MFDETLRQKTAQDKQFVAVLNDAGVLPGIKVDQGTKEMDPPAGGPNEKVTKGIEGLPERLKEYVALGAKFTKWRAVIMIGEGLPTDANIRQNAKDLAQYARIAQEAGLVPIVEPEVLMDGSHPLKRCKEVSERTLTAVFEELKKAGVAIEGCILKTNMVIPGKENPTKASPKTIAEETIALFKKILPQDLPGEAFLSGGQSEIEATENLNAMNQSPLPWKLSFSYGRALQDSALKTWNGKKENVPSAQKILAHRARMNSIATLGIYTKEVEQEKS